MPLLESSPGGRERGERRQTRPIAFASTTLPPPETTAKKTHENPHSPRYASPPKPPPPPNLDRRARPTSFAQRPVPHRPPRRISKRRAKRGSDLHCPAGNLRADEGQSGRAPGGWGMEPLPPLVTFRASSAPHDQVPRALRHRQSARVASVRLRVPRQEEHVIHPSRQRTGRSTPRGAFRRASTLSGPSGARSRTPPGPAQAISRSAGARGVREGDPVANTRKPHCVAPCPTSSTWPGLGSRGDATAVHAYAAHGCRTLERLGLEVSRPIDRSIAGIVFETRPPKKMGNRKRQRRRIPPQKRIRVCRPGSVRISTSHCVRTRMRRHRRSRTIQ